MLGHEQQTFRMALAAALHHSAGLREVVEMQENGALRGLKTAARARKEMSERTTRRRSGTPPSRSDRHAVLCDDAGGLVRPGAG